MINYSENGQGLKVDIQTIGVEMNHYLQRKVEAMTRKLKSLLPQAGTIDVYLKHDTDQPDRPRNVTVRFGVPGPDVVASDSGRRWKIVLKNVEKKLVRQLEKRKAAARNHREMSGELGAA